MEEHAIIGITSIEPFRLYLFSQWLYFLSRDYFVMGTTMRISLSGVY